MLNAENVPSCVFGGGVGKLRGGWHHEEGVSRSSRLCLIEHSEPTGEIEAIEETGGGVIDGHSQV